MNVSGIIELSNSLEQGLGLGQSAGAVTSTGGSEVVGENVFVWTPKPAASSNSNLQELDPAIACPLMEVAKQRCQLYENNQHFQDSWATCLPWAQSVFGKDGRVCQVQCNVCTKVMSREKLVVPKLDSLWKHAGRRKALVD